LIKLAAFFLIMLFLCNFWRLDPKVYSYFNYKHQEEMLERWNYLDKVWYQIYKNEGIYPFFILDPTDVC